MSFTGKQLKREGIALIYHLLKPGKHTLSGSNLHTYLGNQQTASNVWSRHSCSEGLCTGITLFFHIRSVKSLPDPPQPSTADCGHNSSSPHHSALGFYYNTNIFSTTPYFTLSSASFCLMISIGLAAIQTLCRNSTQTVFPGQ